MIGSDTDETPLSGGHSGSQVHRRGQVVLRRARPQSATIQRFLAHLSAEGFEEAPLPLGFEAAGRERLSYLQGLVSHAPEHWADVGRLHEGARLLRRLHDVSRRFERREDDVWGFEHGDGDVLCHNDFAPYNLVLRDGCVAGVIDFDLLGPGPALSDLGYFANWTVPLSFAAADLVALTEADLERGHARLKAVAAAYGTRDFAGLLRGALDMLTHLGDDAAAERLFGGDVRDTLEADGHFAHWRAEAEAFAVNWQKAFRSVLK